MNKDKLISFILDRISYYTDQPVSELNPQSKFEEVGVSSLYAVLICGELEEEFSIELEPALLFDYTTTEAVADFLLMNSDNG